jgi:hypothetical protein
MDWYAPDWRDEIPSWDTTDERFRMDRDHGVEETE